jgi:hypothetical protein
VLPDVACENPARQIQSGIFILASGVPVWQVESPFLASKSSCWCLRLLKDPSNIGTHLYPHRDRLRADFPPQYSEICRFSFGLSLAIVDSQTLRSFFCRQLRN